MQFECTNDPVCLKCKGKGHMAAECQNNSKKLKMCGFGIPGQGFYAFDLPEVKSKINQAVGILTISVVKDTDTIQIEGGENQDDEQFPEAKSNQFVIHSLEGYYLMNKDKWPNLKLPEEEEI